MEVIINNQETIPVNRNIFIDIVSFFACIFITNSRMDILYGPYKILAPGGSIGNAFFFFCVGFTMFLSKSARFDNWYKRRINRLYPSIFAFCFFVSIVGSVQFDVKKIVLQAGGFWFISCIMIHYMILFFIRRYMIKKWQLFFLLYQ